MVARFCGKCQKLIDDITCPHCGMQTELMEMAPPWLEDYEIDEQERDFEDGNGGYKRPELLDSVCPRAR